MYLGRGYGFNTSIKRPAMTQERVSGGIPNTKKYPESHDWIDWVTGYASHSNAQTGVQWLATPLSQPSPLQLASRGWSSPAILPTWDRTNDRKVINPTPTPTKPRWLWWFQFKCVYIYPWTCENVIGIEIRNFKKLTLPGIEPRSAESYTVNIPLD